MIKKLPEWYRIASLVPASTDALESRSKVIASIIENKEISWLFNCVRLYLNKPYDQEFKNELIKLFTDSDQLFQQRDNDLELRVLCGAIIYEYIIGDEYDECIILAISLISANFENKDIINPDILTSIKEYINKKSIELREQNIDLKLFDDVEDVDEDGEETVESLKARIDNTYNITQINDYLRIFLRRIEILNEESNIHWWIFRGFSNYKAKQIKDLDIEIAPIILGKELSDLTKIIPGPLAYEQFLKKLLHDNFQEKSVYIVFKDVINKLEKTDKDKFTEKFVKSNIGNICPLMLAYQEALKIDNDKSWIPYFEKFSGIKTKTSINVIDLACQFYIENLLIKYL